MMRDLSVAETVARVVEAAVKEDIAGSGKPLEDMVMPTVALRSAQLEPELVFTVHALQVLQSARGGASAPEISGRVMLFGSAREKRSLGEISGLLAGRPSIVLVDGATAKEAALFKKEIPEGPLTVGVHAKSGPAAPGLYDAFDHSDNPQLIAISGEWVLLRHNEHLNGSYLKSLTRRTDLTDEDQGKYHFPIKTMHIPPDYKLTPTDTTEVLTCVDRNGVSHSVERRLIKVEYDGNSVNLWCPADFSKSGSTLRADDGFTVTEPILDRALDEMSKNYPYDIRHHAYAVIEMWKNFEKLTPADMILRGALGIVLMAVWDSVETAMAGTCKKSGQSMVDFVRGVVKRGDRAPPLLHQWARMRPPQIRTVKEVRAKCTTRVRPEFGEKPCEELAFRRSGGIYIVEYGKDGFCATTSRGFARISLGYQCFREIFMTFDLPYNTLTHGMNPLGHLMFELASDMMRAPSFRAKKCTGYANTALRFLRGTPACGDSLPPQAVAAETRLGERIRIVSCFWRLWYLYAFEHDLPTPQANTKIPLISFSVPVTDDSPSAQAKWNVEQSAAVRFLESFVPLSFRKAVTDHAVDDMPPNVGGAVRQLLDTYGDYPRFSTDPVYLRICAALKLPGIMDGYVLSAESLALQDFRSRAYIQQFEGINRAAMTDAELEKTDFPYLRDMVKDAWGLLPVPTVAQYRRDAQKNIKETSEGSMNSVTLRSDAKDILPKAASAALVDKAGKDVSVRLKFASKQVALAIAAAYIVDSTYIRSSQEDPITMTTRIAIGRAMRLIMMVWLTILQRQRHLYKCLTAYMRSKNHALMEEASAPGIRYANELGVGPLSQRFLVRSAVSCSDALHMHTATATSDLDGSRFDAHMDTVDRRAFQEGVSLGEQPGANNEEFKRVFGKSIEGLTVEMFESQNNGVYRVPVRKGPDQCLVSDIWASGNTITAAGNSVKNSAMLQFIFDALRAEGWPVHLVSGEAWGDDAYIVVAGLDTMELYRRFRVEFERLAALCGQRITAHSGDGLMTFIRVDFDAGQTVQPHIPIDAERTSTAFGVADIASVCSKIADSHRRGGNAEACSTIMLTSIMCLTSMGSFGKNFRAPMNALLGPAGIGMIPIGIPSPNSRLFLGLHAQPLGLSGMTYKLPSNVIDGGIGKRFADKAYEAPVKGRVVGKPCKIDLRPSIEASQAILIDPALTPPATVPIPASFEPVRIDQSIRIAFEKSISQGVISSTELRRTCIELTLIKAGLGQVGHVTALSDARVTAVNIPAIKSVYRLTNKYSLDIRYAGFSLWWNGLLQDAAIFHVKKGSTVIGNIAGHINGYASDAGSAIVMSLVGESLSRESALVSKQFMMADLDPPGLISANEIVRALDKTDPAEMRSGLAHAGFDTPDKIEKAIKAYNILALAEGMLELADYGATSSAVMSATAHSLNELIRLTAVGVIPPEVYESRSSKVLATCYASLLEAGILCGAAHLNEGEMEELCSLPSFSYIVRRNVD
jgi:hypothetical protein